MSLSLFYSRIISIQSVVLGLRAWTDIMRVKSMMLCFWVYSNLNHVSDVGRA